MRKLYFLASIFGFILDIKCQEPINPKKDVFSQNEFFGSIKEGLQSIFQEIKESQENYNTEFEEDDFIIDRMLDDDEEDYYIDNNDYIGDENVAAGLLRMSLALNNVNLKKFTQPSDYMIYSPLSIGTALALIFLGSNGQTLEEMIDFFQYSGKLNIHHNPNILFQQLGDAIKTLNQNYDKINVATALFVKNEFSIRPIYQQIANEYLKSNIYSLDLGSSRAESFINEWVARETNDKITQLLEGPLSPSTKIVIASTLYFKAAWKQPFIAGQTKRKQFFPDGRFRPSNIEVDMMGNGGEFLYYKNEKLQCEMLSLPYYDNQTFMHLVMPVNSDRNKLDILQRKLTADQLQFMIDNSEQRSVIFVLPKMRLESSMDLRSSLYELGVRSLFDPARANLDLLTTVNDRTNFMPASVGSHLNQIVYLRDHLSENLSGSGNSGLFANQILHKVFIDISETGTEAAAATGSIMTRSGGKMIIKFDVPFLFFIQNSNTKSTLFWGAVKVPTPHYRI